MARHYECLEAGCGEDIVAADEPSLVEAVQLHMAEKHGSFELEDVIVAERAVDATEVTNGKPDSEVIRRFHFTREMIRGPVYRKYKFAINRVWNVDNLD